jgi:hypothetical protein
MAPIVEQLNTICNTLSRVLTISLILRTEQSFLARKLRVLA